MAERYCWRSVQGRNNRNVGGQPLFCSALKITTDSRVPVLVFFAGSKSRQVKKNIKYAVRRDKIRSPSSEFYMSKMYLLGVVQEPADTSSSNKPGMSHTIDGVQN
jgi:hypothetical protein